MRLCQQDRWVFLPLLIDLLVLVAVLGLIRFTALAFRYRLPLFIVYAVFAVVSPALILSLPFFYEPIG